MARPLRIQFAGAIYHVMSRGIERRAIVRDDADRQRRLDWLRRTVETHGWRLHAFVLMNNHDHLFVETPEPNLAAGMQYYNGSYTSYFNRRHRRVGHLFQGRYRGHLIDEEGYFLEVSRYLHLNPVRARLVRRPEDWPWSSFAGYRQVRRTLSWVTYHRVLGEFGTDSLKARRAYERFVRAGIDDLPSSPFTDAVAGLIVGSTEFVARIRGLLKDRPEDPALPQVQRLKRRPTLEEIVATVSSHFGQSQAGWPSGRRVGDLRRAMAAHLARRIYGYPATAVAAALGYRGHSSVHYALHIVEKEGTNVRKLLAVLEEKLSY
ncbi:MAG: transposase [Pirellulales bacterium]|nr:transposase [Pirellulales bacterium]